MNKGGCILLNKDKTKVALVIRKDNEYSFPKGHLEKNEKLIDCALRETEEETGRKLKLLTSKYTKHKYHTDKEGNITVYMYYVMDDGITNKIINDYDKEKMVWIDIDKVYDVLSYDNLKEFWIKAIKIIKKIN